MQKVINISVYIFAGIGLVLVLGHFAIKFGITNSKGMVDKNTASAFLNKKPIKEEVLWQKTEEWKVLEESIKKDKDTIIKAGVLSGTDPRLIFSVVAVEQMRLFTSNRTLFKDLFSPLKILGSQSQFSWGVSGIKQETARLAEKYLKDESSEFFPGKEYSLLLDFKTENPDEERFERIVNDPSNFYSYLYTGVILKEMESQWQKLGFPIKGKIGILGTLYNIGFQNSKPKENPKVGGASIFINEEEYTFGGLTHDIYWSNSLIEEFRREN